MSPQRIVQTIHRPSCSPAVPDEHYSRPIYAGSLGGVCIPIILFAQAEVAGRARWGGYRDRSGLPLPQSPLAACSVPRRAIAITPYFLEGEALLESGIFRIVAKSVQDVVEHFTQLVAEFGM